jgi:murein DD-endopeptidase MepM/ murein hydrolase activator NlpD
MGRSRPSGSSIAPKSPRRRLDPVAGITRTGCKNFVTRCARARHPAAAPSPWSCSRKRLRRARRRFYPRPRPEGPGSAGTAIADQEGRTQKEGGRPVRWFAWTTIPMVVLLATGSTVTGTVAAQPRTASGLASAKSVRDHPPSRSRSETVATLRARWPVRGPINSGFGTRGSFWSRHFHAGVDIGARRGTPVRAPAAGTVAFAGWRSGYGRTVIIDHGGQVRSLYGHLSKVDVRPRQRVAAGAEIGLTGKTGNASGSHLHYEVLVNGSPVNPRDRSVRFAEPLRPIRTAARASSNG